MATFKYNARDASGRAVAGAIDADTEVMVIGKLQEMGFFVTSLEKQAGRGAGISIGRLRGLRRVGLHELTVFARQFATMVNAVRAGEVGGVLDDVLNRVATFFEKDLALRQKVRAAITYPAAIMTFALGVIFFLVFFILPQFIGFFKGLDLVLPLPTRVLIFGTELLTGYWYVFLGFILLALYGFRMYVNTPTGRFRFDQFKLRVPIFGPLVRKVIISRFTRTLGTLISSGVPIMQALEVVAKAVENKVVSQAIENVRSSIREGESIAVPLQSSGLFPPMVVQMTAVGEETGTLDSMLQKVADFYDAEVETTLAQLTSILEPL